MRKTQFNKTQDELALQWGTSQKNISLQARRGCNFDAPDKEVANWLLANCMRKPKPMVAAIDAVLQREPIQLEEDVRSLEEMRKYYGQQLDAASKGKPIEKEAVKFWNDLLLKADESLRRSEAHSKRLGLDTGDLLTRGEVERILRAMLWGGNACCDKFAQQIAQALSHKPPAEVYEILAPNLTFLTMFAPLSKLAQVPGDINLPQWVVDCVRREQDQYVE